LRTLKLTLAYDGTRFVGWQRQASGESVQGILEQALSRFEGAPVTVFGAGRTDAGVHALGQVAHVCVTFQHDTATLRRALNAQLPDDIRVTAVDEAPPGLSIGLTLLLKPKLLLLDEPSSDLAPAMVDLVFAAIGEIHRRLSLPILLVEQNVEKALAIAERVVVLVRGTQALDVPAGEVDRRHLHALFLDGGVRTRGA